MAPRHRREVRPRRRALPRRLDPGLGAEGPRAHLEARRPGGAASPAARRDARADRRGLQDQVGGRSASPCSVTPTCACARRRSSSSSIATRPPSCSRRRGRPQHQLDAHPRHVGDRASSRGRTRAGAPARRRSSRTATPEIRAQAAKLLGDVRYGAGAPTLVPMLQRRVAARALLRRRGARPRSSTGRRSSRSSRCSPRTTTRTSTSATPARSRCRASAMRTPIAALVDATRTARVRIAAVVALRRMKDAGVARFLADQDEYIVTEAARAINDDGGIEGALPALAAALDSKFANEPFVRRAINANLRVGTRGGGARVARVRRRHHGERRDARRSDRRARRLAEAVDPRSRRRHGPSARCSATRRSRARALAALVAADLRQRQHGVAGRARRRRRPAAA